MNAELPDEAALIADLRATYPGLHVRPLREYGGHWKDGTGAWVGGEALMPDGLAIFDRLADSESGYDGGVHLGFTQWLEDRGWYLECEDYGTYMAVSILATQRQFGMTQEECDAVVVRSRQAMLDQYKNPRTSGNGFAGDLGQWRPVLIPVGDDEVPF